MDGVNISDLGVAGALTGAELFEVLQGGVNKQVSLSTVFAYIGTANNLATVLSYGNSTGGTDIIVDDTDYIFVGTSQDGYFHYNTASTRVELKNSNSDDMIYFSDAGGITAMLNSGQFMRLESGQFLVYGNASGTAKLQTGSSSNLIYHPTANYFNAPLHNFVGDVTLASETASTIPWLDGTKALKSSNMTSDGNWIYFPNNYGIEVPVTGGTDVLNIATSNADVINIGWSGAAVNIMGTVTITGSQIDVIETNLRVKDKLFTINKGGAVASGSSSGFEIEENAVITGYFSTNGSRNGWDFKAPAISGVATFSLASLSGNHTYTLPDSTGTLLLNNTGFAQGGNAFTATAVLGTTDAYGLNFITNNTVVAGFTSGGIFNYNGGNAIGSDFSIHQTTASAGATGRIIDIYNNAQSKQLFLVTDASGAGGVYLAASALVADTYSGNVAIAGGLSPNSARLRLKQSSANDIIAINPSSGNGGLYANDGGTGNAYFYGQDSTSATTIFLTTSGVSYFNGGGVDIGATAGAGYLGLKAQSSAPSNPSSTGLRLYANSTGSLAWVNNDGASDTYIRTLTATLTGNRTYTLQDASSTLAMYSNKLSVFAATTSAELAGVISDETGTGSLVFATSPTFTTKITSPEVDISGTGGAGFINFVAQSSNASAPSSTGFNLFADSTGKLSWARKNGADTYVRQFDAALTANRTYTLQDSSDTFVMRATTDTLTNKTLTTPILSSSTSNTAGSFGYDGTCAYFTTDTNDQGVIPAVKFIRQDSTYTLSNSASVQQLFNGSTNGRLTLPVGTYRFNCLFKLSSMDTTSGNAAFSIASGTATTGSFIWTYYGVDTAPTTGPFNLNGGNPVTSASAASMQVAGVANQMVTTITGTFEVTVSGTIIPSIQLVNAAAAIVAVGSYFECWPIGSTSVAYVGAWD